jgi:L-lactate dehydrogenase complex protein LldG
MEVTSRIRNALRQVDTQPELRPVESPSVEIRDRIATFVTEFEKVGGKVMMAGSRSEVADYLAKIIKLHKITKVAFSDAPVLKELRLEEDLGDRFGKPVKLLRIDRSQGKEDLVPLLGDVDLGITSCQFAISDTGTLVLEGEKERNRLLSLLPPVHIVVLYPDQVLGSLTEVLRSMDSKKLDQAVTLVTGPSRTADIELTLTKGVHGPREIHAVVINFGADA